MGTYITFDNVDARYPVIITAYKDESQMEADCITYAEQEVNNLLAPGFSTPLPVSTSVKDLMIDACYVRYLRMKNPEKYKEVVEGFNDRIKRILAGDEYLTDAAGDALKPTRSEDEPYDLNEDYSPTMSMLDPSEPAARVSQDRLQDITDNVN